MRGSSSLPTVLGSPLSLLTDDQARPHRAAARIRRDTHDADWPASPSPFEHEASTISTRRRVSPTHIVSPAPSPSLPRISAATKKPTPMTVAASGAYLACVSSSATEELNQLGLPSAAHPAFPSQPLIRPTSRCLDTLVGKRRKPSPKRKWRTQESSSAQQPLHSTAATASSASPSFKRPGRPARLRLDTPPLLPPPAPPPPPPPLRDASSCEPSEPILS